MGKDKAIKVLNDLGLSPLFGDTWMAVAESGDEEKEERKVLVQWSDMGDGKFAPAGRTTPRLSPGVYECNMHPTVGLIVHKREIKTDELIDLPDSASAKVIEAIQKFWTLRKKFEERGQLYKRGMLLFGPPGCHAKGTGIVMADGSIKPIEEIEVGEKVMGPDSRPRIVLQLRRGKDKMYKITPIKGEPFIVNGHHVLSLSRSGEKDRNRPEVLNTTVNEFLELSKCAQERFKLRKCESLEFGNNPYLPLDPYYLGVWLGDGTSANTSITTADPEIEQFIYEYGAKLGTRIRKDNVKNNRASCYHFVGDGSYGGNPVLNLLRTLDLLGNKHIPKEYLTASEEVRLQILAGIVDTDGSYSAMAWRANEKIVKKGWKDHYDVIQVRENLAREVAQLARSLGLGVSLSKCTKTIKSSNFSGTYWRLSIYGDISRIPVKIERKKAQKGTPNKNPLVTGIKDIEPVGRGTYYGFTLSDDHLYMTEDFTIHHNSGKSASLILLAKDLVARGGIVLNAKMETYATMQAIQAIRSIENDRPIIVLLEDIDETLKYQSESNLLSLLDGEEQTDNCVFLASTNYPETLPPRFINRPSRFDEVIRVGMPNDTARRIYLKSRLLEGDLTESELDRWVAESEGLSLAHLRELVIGVFCFERTFEETLERLRKMKTVPSSSRDNDRGFGFH